MEDTLRPTILQPPLYFFVLWQSAALIDPLQLDLGIAVSVREAGYLITTLACCWANPSFLLVNVAASVREIQTLRPDLLHFPFKDAQAEALLCLLGYVVAPEKYVGFALFLEGGLELKNPSDHEDAAVWDYLSFYMAAI